MQNMQPDIIISEQDAEKLDELLAKVSQKDFPGKADLERELDRATLIPAAQIPGDVVTMNSKVRFKDLNTSKSLTMTLVYPKHAGQDDTVSVLAPMGAALLGLSVGQQISWPKTSGGVMLVEIEEILYQPERDGVQR